MQLQSKFNLYLDYKGYQVEEKTYRVVPSPLMGTKFTTGRSAYASLDFWQIGAVTDFSKGMNQKFMIDPSMCYYSIGLDLSRPGEFKLERDTVDFDGLPEEAGNITAHYRTLTKLYLGDDEGNIMSSSDGVTFALEKATGEAKIFGFYNIVDKLFATSGPGFIWADKDQDGTWVKTALSTEFPLEAYDEDTTDFYSVYDTTLAAQTFKVPMGGSTFHTLKLKLKKLGTPGNDLTVTIHEEDLDNKGEPLDAVIATFTFAKASVTTSYVWMDDTISVFDLKANKTYFIKATSAGGGASNCWKWMVAKGSLSTYDFGNAKTYDGSEWTDLENEDMYFSLTRNTINKMYYPMVESDYGFGWFDDGIRRTTDGYNWVPEPPDPLWVMPTGEGIPLNAVVIPRGFISGSKRGLWSFVGGSSGYNIWSFPDYVDANNFKGMDKWSHYCIFSVENQGLYYTEGSQVLPTTMNYLEEGFTFANCACIFVSGWDAYACVSDNGSDWYLIRSNLNYSSQPKYWWIVKKLDKTPVHMAGWNPQKIYIFYDDDTAESFSKTSGDYVESGYMYTSIIDEELVKIQKLYNNLSLIYDAFPTDTTSYIGYRLGSTGSFTGGSFAGDGDTTESVFNLANPTLGNKIQIKAQIDNTEGHRDITPIVTDVTWKYILESPVEDTTTKRTFNFTLKLEDWLEQDTGDVHEEDVDAPRDREALVDALWASSAKKKVLNFIGADNTSEVGLEIEYTGAETSCVLTIDRTNYTISTSADSNTYDYEDKTITEVAAEINGWTGYTCTVHADQEADRTAHDLEPRNDLQIKGGAYVMVGSDIHAVIMVSSPVQNKQAIDGRGSDRAAITLREA